MTATYNGVSKFAAKTISIAAASSENPDNPDTPDTPSEESKITITYSSSHGNTPSSKSYDKTDSGYILTADDLPALTETGYIFGGWTKEVVSTGVGGEASPTVTTTTDTGSITIVKAGETITENTTLYAIWTAITYTVKFDANGGSGDAVSEISAAYDVEFDVPANSFTYDGYNASANTWNTSKDGSGTVLIAGNKAKNLTAENGATVTLYAIWIEKGAHLITYLDSDGTTAISGMSPVTFKEEEAVDLSKAVPEKTGYTFAGWSESVVSAGSTIPDAGSTTAGTTTGWKAGEKTSDVVLYAVWTANTYTVTFTSNGGIGDDLTQEFSFGTTAALKANTFTRTGYTFLGWSEVSTSSTTSVDYADEAAYITPASDKTLYAIWDANTYTIIFDSNNSSSSTSAQSVKYGTTITLDSNPFTYSGYRFTSWNTVANGTGSSYSDGGEFAVSSAENVTLYAQWAEADRCIITYKNIKGADNSSPTSYRETEGATLSEVSAQGYTFDGWYDSEDSDGNGTGNKVSGWGADEKSGDITLYAKWIPRTDTAYTVEHYQENADDSGYTLKDTDNLTGTTGEQTAATAKSYGHFTAQAFSQAEIAADGSTKITVKYDRETITFTLDLAGGTLDGKTGSITKTGKYGQSITVNDPARAGYTFTGWNSEGGTIAATYDEDTTYKALWSTANSISVTVQSSEVSVKKMTSGNTLTFTAEKCDSYAWYIDEEEVSTDQTYTLDASSLVDGTYTLALEVKKDGKMYSYFAQIVVSK